MSRIYGNIGFTGLWNGLPTRIVMIGTLTAFQWLMYVSLMIKKRVFKMLTLVQLRLLQSLAWSSDHRRTLDSIRDYYIEGLVNY